MRSKIAIMDLTRFDLPKPAELPAALIDFCDIPKTLFGMAPRKRYYTALFGSSKKDEIVEEEAEEISEEKSEEESEEDVKLHREVSESQIAALLGLHAFEISNNLSTGRYGYDPFRLYIFGDSLKHVAQASSSWKEILTAGSGATSRALIEKLFGFSIMAQDRTLAELMLQIGADPNQQIFDSDLQIDGSDLASGMCVSALDYAIRRTSNSIANLLLDSGAVYGQTSLKQAIMARDLDTADRILKFDQSLDMDFNYLDSIDQHTISFLGHLKLEKATLLGLVCLDVCSLDCRCDESQGPSNESHSSRCPRYTSITSLEFLIRAGATINLDTMILASFNADVATIRFLMQHGGKVDGFNLFGFSCLDAASLRNVLQYDILSLLLAAGATTNVFQAHHVSDSRESLLNRLLLCHTTHSRVNGCELHNMIDLLINSGSNINYRALQPGSPSELALAREQFLWSQSIQHATPADLIAQSKAESPLEYAIVLGCEGIALTLVNRDCQLTGREMALAVKMGSNVILHVLIERDRSGFDKESTGRTCLRLALRWGHDDIVRHLLERGVEFGGHDIIDALQYPGRSVLSTKTQIELIRATPGLDRLQIFGLSLLELCSVKFRGDALRDILTRFPAAYDSGALAAIVIRSLNQFDECEFSLKEIQALVSRRTESNCDWEKENTALLFAALFHSLDVLRILITRNSTRVTKKARIPRKDFSLFLKQIYYPPSFSHMDPQYSIGCQDWVPCSPLMGIAMMPAMFTDWDVCNEVLDHLLACSYEPDAFAVVIAAAKGNLRLLRRFQCLENWQSILSIDDDSRPPWYPTALQVAASNGFEKVVEFLLEAGTSVNEAPAEEPIDGCLPRTALQAAIDSGSIRLMDPLIERGAFVNAPAAEDWGATALQLACIHGYLTISLRLLELGADVNARGAQKHGRTALEGAAEHGRIDTIQLLLNRGACTDGVYREQYLKAVLYAESNRHFTAAALLKEHREWTAEDEECYQSLQLIGLYND